MVRGLEAWGFVSNISSTQNLSSTTNQQSNIRALVVAPSKFTLSVCKVDVVLLLSVVLIEALSNTLIRVHSCPGKDYVILIPPQKFKVYFRITLELSFYGEFQPHSLVDPDA